MESKIIDEKKNKNVRPRIGKSDLKEEEITLAALAFRRYLALYLFFEENHML